MPVTAEDYDVIARIVDERVKEIKVTREDFSALKHAVEELAQAQKNAEVRLTNVEGKLTRVEELLIELAEAQKQTDQALKELAEAQKKTERALYELTHGLTKTRKELGGLSHTVGYHLEDISYQALPPLLEKEEGLSVCEKLKRSFVLSDDGDEEVNIVGKAKKNGNVVWILGEAQTQTSIKHIKKFLSRMKRLDDEFPGEKFFVYVTYSARPEVVSYAKEHRVKLVHSYEFETQGKWIF